MTVSTHSTSATARRLPVAAVLRAALRQAASDLRPHVVGAGLVGTLLSAAVILGAGHLLRDEASSVTSLPYGTMMLAGIVGSFGATSAVQIASAYYTERLGGGLLRVRILPHGPLVWTLGTIVSSTAMTTSWSVVIVLVAPLVVVGFPFSALQALQAVGLLLCCSLAGAPLGFLVGAVARGVYTQLASYLVLFAAACTSGCFLPLADMPRWVQLAQQALPLYWSGQLSRQILVGDPSWELGGTFSTGTALAVLATWVVAGLTLVPVLVRPIMARETIGSLARLQATVRRQTGL